MQIQKFELESFTTKANEPNVPAMPEAEVPPGPQLSRMIDEMKEAQAEEPVSEDLTPPPPPPPPAITEAEMEAAKKAAYQEGYQQGMEAADKEAAALAKHTAEVLEQISVQLGLIATQLESNHSHMTEEMVHAVLAIAKKVAGEALKTEPLEEVGRLIKETMELLQREPELTITVHTSLKDQLEKEIDALKTRVGFKGVVHLLVFPEEMGLTNCRVEWQDGKVELDKEALWKHIENLLETYSGVKS